MIYLECSINLMNDVVVIIPLVIEVISYLERVPDLFMLTCQLHKVTRDVTPHSECHKRQFFLRQVVQQCLVNQHPLFIEL